MDHVVIFHTNYYCGPGCNGPLGPGPTAHQALWAWGPLARRASSVIFISRIIIGTSNYNTGSRIITASNYMTSGNITSGNYIITASNYNTSRIINTSCIINASCNNNNLYYYC